jgi:hypothetical protein
MAAWVAAIASLIAVVLAVKPLKWAWRLLFGIHEFLADWPRMKLDIRGLQEEIAAIKAETRPDGGNSIHDFVHRTARDVADIKKEQAEVRTKLEIFDARHTGREEKP